MRLPIPVLPRAACALLPCLFVGASAAAPAPTAAKRVDAVLAPWSGPDRPGCAVAIVQSGHVMLARGYGRANLEVDAPITPRTVFDIGSVSKQFTALSVLLLAQDGRLALDDEIHRFLPELPVWDAPITVRDLLHHLSGLPSYTDLFDLAGVPEIDLTTDADALALIARQDQLNFAPGRQYLYSDTNYFLLSLIVRRVSGRSLGEFAAARIFEPLGMRDTHFHDDHRMIVRGRATGYAPRARGGFEIDMSNFEELGDGSVMTTVLDLARWERNFDDARVGGRALLEEMQTPGRRGDGSATPYAMGLVLDTYRGVPRIQHTGEWVGYRAALLRYPDRHLGVILLCNQIGGLDALGVAEQLSDIYLEGAQAQATDRAPASEMRAVAGEYWDPATLTHLRFRTDGGALRVDDGDAEAPLRYLGAHAFAGANSATRYVFAVAPADASGATAVRVESDDGDPFWLQRTAPADPATDLATYAGAYDCANLGATWNLVLDAGRLVRRQPLYPEQALRALRPDVFAGDLSEGRYILQFTRDGAGAVDGFRVGTSMVRPLRCTRRAASAGAHQDAPGQLP